MFPNICISVTLTRSSAITNIIFGTSAAPISLINTFNNNNNCTYVDTLNALFCIVFFSYKDAVNKTNNRCEEYHLPSRTNLSYKKVMLFYMVLSDHIADHHGQLR